MKNILILILFLSQNSCVIKQFRNQGIVAKGMRMYDSKGREQLIRYSEKDIKLFFRDSTVLIEVTSLRILDKADGSSLWKQLVEKYTMLDLRTMIHYDYRTFSDTATLLRKYKLPDTSFVAWKFFGYSYLSDTTVQFEKLNDTIIDGVKKEQYLGRKKYTANSGEVNYVFRYFSDCSRKKSIFHLDRHFDEQPGHCPATRFDYYVIGNEDNVMSTGYKFLADTLTSIQKSIFDQWEKNAKTTKLPLEFGVKFELVYDEEYEKYGDSLK